MENVDTPKKRGPKPVEDRKITFAIHPRVSRIDTIGFEKAKAIALDAIEKAYDKIINQQDTENNLKE